MSAEASPRPTVNVVATLTAADGKAEELEAVLLSMLPASRADDGCIRYELFRDGRDPNVFVFVEEWRDMDAVKAHGAQPHMAEAGNRMKGLLAGRPEIRYCRHVG